MTEQKTNPQSILNHIAQEDIPEREIDLWPILQKNLVSSKSDKPQRGTSMLTQRFSKRLISVLASLTMILFLGFFLFTPSGQALAQSVMRFFTRQSSDVLPSVNLILTPTKPVVLADVSTQTPITTATPSQPGCDSILAVHCTIEQVQSMLPFQIKQLSKLPKAMSLDGAVMQGQQVVLVYRCPSGCFLLLNEGPVKGEVSKDWVGASAQIKSVQIQTSNGFVQGEYVKGGYTGVQGGTNTTWDSSQNTYALRWEEEAILYSIQWSIATPDKSGIEPNAELLAALAESLAVNPNLALDPNHMLTSADASLAAGFSVRVPGYAPKGWDLAFYTYDAGTGFVCLNYATGGMVDHARLFVRESATAPLMNLQPAAPVYPGAVTPSPIQYEQVTVGGADNRASRFTRSHFEPPAKACNGQNEFLSTNEVLQWTSRGMTYEIYAAANPFSELTVSKLDLLRMAESITGVTTIPVDALDPEHLWTIADAEKLAGFNVNTPTKLPEGYTFSMARIENSAVISMYRAPDPNPDILDLNSKPPAIFIYLCPVKNGGQDLCTQSISNIPSDVREMVQINHHQGFFAKGDLNADESSNWKMVWHADDIALTRRLYWKSGDMVYLVQLMWGGAIDRATMILIADNLQ